MTLSNVFSFPYFYASLKGVIKKVYFARCHAILPTSVACGVSDEPCCCLLVSSPPFADVFGQLYLNEQVR